MRRFNITGPCVEGRHYMIEPLGRLPEAGGFIDQGAYFVVHAPRQTGKSTTLLATAAALTREGRYTALYTSCQPIAELTDLAEVMAGLAQQIALDAELLLPLDLRPPPPQGERSVLRLLDFLSAWSQASPRPVVLMLDEIDALQGPPLLSATAPGTSLVKDGAKLGPPQ